MYEYNGNLVVINIFITAISILYYRNVYHSSYLTKSLDYRFIGLMLILYSVFAFAEADTYHYHSIYDEMLMSYDPIHVEKFYFWLIKSLPTNYYLWRLSIWGTSAILLVKSLKRMKIDANTIGLILPILAYSQFSLTRGVLGFSLAIYALVQILSNNKSIIKILFWGLIIVLSSYLHRSLPIFLILAPIAYIFPFKKNILFLSLFIFPFLYFGVTGYVDQLLSSVSLSDDLMHHAEVYTEMEKVSANWKGMIQIIIVWSGILISLVQLSKYYLKYSTNKFIIFMMKYSYILIYISALFYGQQYTSFIYTRFIHAATFPLIFCMGDYFYEQKRRTKMDKIALYLLTLNTMYNLFYFAWKWR